MMLYRLSLTTKKCYKLAMKTYVGNKKSAFDAEMHSPPSNQTPTCL
jgi:hypothetical protein